MSSHLHRVCAFAWLSLSPPCSPVVSNVTLHCSWQTAQALFLLCVFTFSCSKESQVQQPSWPDHFLYDFTVSEDLVSSSLTISPRDVHSLSSCLQITTNSFSVLLLFFQSSPNSAAGSVLSSQSQHEVIGWQQPTPWPGTVATFHPKRPPGHLRDLIP